MTGVSQLAKDKSFGGVLPKWFVHPHKEKGDGTEVVIFITIFFIFSLRADEIFYLSP